jgi:hypothetical protein
VTEIKAFAETARGLARNPLGIIALFIVLVYALAALVTGFAGSLSSNERWPLVCFLVVFPVLVLAVFAWLVSQHATKLYAPSDYADQRDFVDLHLNRLELRVLESPVSMGPSGARAPSVTPGSHGDSRLAIAQLRLDLEHELFLLARHTLRDFDATGWTPSRYVKELERNAVLEPSLADDIRSLVAVADTVVHQSAIPEEQIQRAIAAGGIVVKTLRHRRFVSSAERDFDAHGLWHMHGHVDDASRKYYFWSAVAASLPEFDWDYDIYREAVERYNQRAREQRTESRTVYVLSLDEFIKVLELREAELKRIIDAWPWEGSDEVVYWQWPSDWGDLGWSSPILRERPHLWGAEEDLMRTRAALAQLRPRLESQRKSGDGVRAGLSQVGEGAG